MYFVSLGQTVIDLKKILAVEDTKEGRYLVHLESGTINVSSEDAEKLKSKLKGVWGTTKLL